MRTFSWNFTVGAAGAHVFSTTATGTTCGALPVSALAGASLNAVAASALSGTVLVTPAGPVAVGQLLVVSLTVNNTGGAAANGVVPAVTPSGAAGVFAGPVPAGPVAIAGGANRTFVWTFTAMGAGAAAFAAAAAGTDANSGLTVNMPATAAPATLVLAPAALVIDSIALTPGPNVRFTATLTATVVVRNTGQEDATVTALVRAPTDASVLILQSAPSVVPPFALAGGASRTVTWTYLTAGTCGFSGVTVTVSGTSVMTASALSVAALSGAVGVAGLPVTVTAVPEHSSVPALASTPVTVTVRDGCGVAVPGAPVSAVVIADTGGTAVSPASGITDAAGQVILSLKVGAMSGANSIRVDVASGTNPSATATVQMRPPDKPTPYLSQNQFNPGRGERLKIRILEPARVRLAVRVYNLAGELIRKVCEADVQPGLTVWEWDGRTAQGGAAANGIYFVQIQSGQAVEIRRVIVLRF
jgi:hypothetical protein